MLTKWFGTNGARRSQEVDSFCPRLESLEDRLPPSAMHGEGPGANVVQHQAAQVAQANQPTDRDDRHGNPGQGDDREHGHDHDNDNPFVNFNITINIFMQGPNLGQAFQGLLQGLGQNGSALNTLIKDEFSLAQDQVLSYVDTLLGIPNTALQSTITQLQNDISNNPAEQTAAGMLVGDLAYDLGLLSLVSGSGNLSGSGSF